MAFLVLLLMEVIIAAFLAGSLCGSMGVYLKRMNLLTLSFTVAHAALAGASVGLLLDFSPEFLAFIFGLIAAIFVESIHQKIGIDRELISMGIFSLSSALAMFAIYAKPAVTLTSETASLILWGSILAVTISKIILLVGIACAFTLYIFAFKMEINSILFDSKLAAAEGINVSLHSTFLVLITAATIAIILRLTGGFLVFSLLFNPSMSAIRISHKRQPLLGALFGGLSAVAGVLISFSLDTPIGATISISSSIILMFAVTYSSIREVSIKKRIQTIYAKMNSI